ncbi:hypothetical protein CLV91_1591 [Maribacter vaceletii]|uniref:Uncharacterized protein n=1 Tax=Maribacter vaceletii TaxID=1206816 RepID=A0A495E8H9_9FLAO|nr:hypothetical protein [Maribacter vaceletii]RKR12879.1 hypothetical protein CLV91_1591 [Maribacter vaceletii]
MPTKSNKKIKHLFLSLLFDGIGMLSFAVPFLGDFSDVIWAPISAWLMIKLYKGKIGKAAGVVSFVEEIIPGLDVIPTFTIMWLYTYVFKKSKFSKIIDVD